MLATPVQDELTPPQPGHEYTKANVAFALSVSQAEPIRKLGAYMAANEESQGIFTIGDEKVRCPPLPPPLLRAGKRC